MSNIENNPEAWHSTFEALTEMKARELIDQHFIHHGTVYALQFVLKHNADRSLIEKMLLDARTMQDLIAATAATRGVQILSQQA
ncbi:hypothetical protein GCM10027093_61540 [Paraburkholderia jirisanensis]